MARITSVRGMYNNVKTYEHICDTMTDMINIKNEYRTYGSICIVINGGADNIEIYTADSNNNWISIGIINGNPTTNELKKMINAIVENSSDTVDTVHTAGEYAEASEAWAVGTRNGAPIGETDLAYENNAKKYALDSEAWAIGQRGGTAITDNEDPVFENNAKKYATDAGGSAVAAMSLAKDAEAWANGTQYGQPIPSSHPAFEKNAKYWSDHAFSHTPEGYEALVIDVDNIKADIKEKVDQIKKEKADINYVIELYTQTEHHENAINALVNELNEETEERTSITNALTAHNQQLDNEIKIKADLTQLAAIAIETDKNSADLYDINNKIDDMQYDINNVQKNLTNTPKNAEFVALAAETDALSNEISNILAMIKTKAEYNELSALQTEVDNLEKSKVNPTELNNELVRNTTEVLALAAEVDKNITEIDSAKDTISSIQGSIAEMRDSIATKIPKPTENPSSDYKVLIGNRDGSTEWSDPITPSDELIEEAVFGWLEEHPEATTTVGNGTITEEKLSPELAAKVNESDSAYDAQVLGDLIQVGTPSEERYMYDRMIRHGTEIFYRYFDKLQEFGSHFTGGDGIGFLWFTDPHNLSPQAYGFNQDDMLEQMQFVRTIFYNTAARYVLCGGDIFNGADYTFEQAVWLVNRAPNILRELISERCYTVVGNHDEEWWGSDHRNYTDQKRARIWYDSDVGYYTVDTSNVRCFMFDSGKAKNGMTTYTLEQAKWFADMLTSNTFPHLYGAIHYVLTTDGPDWLSVSLTEIANAFNNRSTYTINGQYNYNFSEATGKFHFILAGHYHNDNNDTINGIPVIWTKAFVIDRSIDCCYADFDAEKLYLIRINYKNNGITRTINI